MSGRTRLQWKCGVIKVADVSGSQRSLTSCVLMNFTKTSCATAAYDVMLYCTCWTVMLSTNVNGNLIKVSSKWQHVSQFETTYPRNVHVSGDLTHHVGDVASLNWEYADENKTQLALERDFGFIERTHVTKPKSVFKGYNFLPGTVRDTIMVSSIE